MVGRGSTTRAGRGRSFAGAGTVATYSTPTIGGPQLAEPSPSRQAWTLFEPIHAIVYFAPEARESFAAAGLRGGWMGYFASRSAPMGAVSADVVTAVFHNFQPAMVRRAIPDAWSYSTPERVLGARLAAADAALRRLWGEVVESADVREAAELALGVAARLRVDGRPLFAGHAGLTVPDSAHLALWHACTMLREHRFDGHIAALTVHEIDGVAALVIAAAAGRGVDADTLRRFRGWTEDEWSEGRERLRQRGIVEETGVLTAEGNALHAAVEEATDRLAAGPWEQLEASRRKRLFELLAGLAARLEGEGGLIYPNPIGVGRPV